MANSGGSRGGVLVLIKKKKTKTETVADLGYYDFLFFSFSPYILSDFSLRFSEKFLSVLSASAFSKCWSRKYFLWIVLFFEKPIKRPRDLMFYRYFFLLLVIFSAFSANKRRPSLQHPFDILTRLLLASD